MADDSLFFANVKLKSVTAKPANWFQAMLARQHAQELKVSEWRITYEFEIEPEHNNG